MRKLVLGMAAAATLVGGLASPAAADPVPESDGVAIQLSGANRASGSIWWSSYRKGSGTIYVYNDLYDGQCVALSDRIMVGGVWRDWRHVGTVCTQASYPFVVARDPGVNIQYWQFRLKESVTERAGYDTNQPGGA